MKHRKIICWFRRDLRLSDNTALRAALEDAKEVIPVFVLSSWRGEHAWTGEKRQAFLCESLRCLAESLKGVGSRLIFRKGDAEVALGELVKETGATAIYAARDPDGFGRETERCLVLRMGQCGVEVKLHQDCCVHERDSVLTKAGEPYRVFTPYAKSWKALSAPVPSGNVCKMPGVSESLFSLPLPRIEDWGLSRSDAKILAGGEAAARERLAHFLKGGLHEYTQSRDVPSLAGTSRISQDLRFGLLSPREVVAALSEEKKCVDSGISGAEKFLNELIWREFYMQLLWHFPGVLREEFNAEFRGLVWPGKQSALDRWKNAETGFPIVDAGMRELLQTGFMHNRERMISSMFLTKDLHVDWRHGESWFLRHLVDGEIASNNGGWQWSAGTGADAAPYFRIQNPWTQTRRYDSEGTYIKKWLPELSHLPAESFFSPPPEGKSLVPGYPHPMVDHGAERIKTLELFSARKGKK